METELLYRRWTDSDAIALHAEASPVGTRVSGMMMPPNHLRVRVRVDAFARSADRGVGEP